jgi:hypothetical protein
MKKLVFFFVILMTGLLSLPVFSQIDNEPTALGLPGDNLNLYAVLDVFQKSKTLEEFERVLNSRDSNINNLDLNNDNVIDYIEVVSYKEGNSYSIVLRVAINNNEYQDVAVIEVNKNSSGRIVVQIVGDEELYGENYIVEPYYSETRNPGYTGNEDVIINNYGNDILYADYWPIVIRLYSSAFRLYISPWHWGFYPSYWSPWTPIFYHNYWSYNYNYYRNRPYRRTVYVRDPIHYSYYSARRSSSPIVRRNRINGDYNRVYDGRVYRRPEAPIDRPLNRSIPSRVNPRGVPDNRLDRPTAPLNRRVLPSGRSGNQPDSRQGVPVNPRQSDQPMNRPGVPLNRRPFNQGGNQQQAPSNPRQSNPPANRQRVPENRSERINRNSPPPPAPRTDRPVRARDKN